VTVPLTEDVHCWMDRFDDRTPLLTINTPTIEVCVVLPPGPISVAQLRTAHQIADTAAAFALGVSHAAAHATNHAAAHDEDGR